VKIDVAWGAMPSASTAFLNRPNAKGKAHRQMTCLERFEMTSNRHHFTVVDDGAGDQLWEEEDEHQEVRVSTDRAGATSTRRRFSGK
jgi:hypothetical protein